MNIIGNGIILRAIEDSDKSFLLEIINDPEIEFMIGGWSWPVSLSEQETWISKVRLDSTTKRFIIELNKKPMGLVILADIDWKNRSAFTGIKLHQDAPRHMGIGTNSMQALQKYAFDELQLHRLETTWVEYNNISEKLHLKCGWQIEGIKRQSIYKRGQYYDQKCASLLIGDYLNTINA